MPPPAAPATGGGGALAALLVAQAFLVLAFFVLSIVVTWIRAERGVAPSVNPALPSWSAPQPTSVAPSSGEWIAVVSETKGLPGVIREQPSMQATKTGTVPPGAEVDVLDAREAGRKWYRVRTRGRLPALVGWMHTDILRPR
jgi:hypothetical protein